MWLNFLSVLKADTRDLFHGDLASITTGVGMTFSLQFQANAGYVYLRRGVARTIMALLTIMGGGWFALAQTGTSPAARPEPQRMAIENVAPNLGDGRFRLFSAMEFPGNPDLRGSGFRVIKGLGEAVFHRLYEDSANNREFRALPASKQKAWFYARLPEEGHYKSLLRKMYDQGASVIFLDVEATLPIRAQPGDGHKRCTDAVTCAAETKLRLNYFLTLNRWAKEAVPKAKVGFYLPVMSYAGSQLGADNARAFDMANISAMLPLLQAQDILMPTLYLAFGPNDKTPHTLAGSRHFANETAKVLRAAAPSIPILPFIMHEYSFEHSKKHPGEHIPFWGELLTAYKDAGFNGVILWGYDYPNNRPVTFDPAAPWWVETAAFARQYGTVD
jgi:hypothetical protein